MFGRVCIAIAVVSALVVSADGSDLCDFQPSQAAQRVTGKPFIYNPMRVFADTSQSHTPPTVPAGNARSFEPVSGIESLVDTVVIRGLVHPKGIVLDAAVKKSGRQPMSECLALQWIADVTFIPAHLDGKPCCGWKTVAVFVDYYADSLLVQADAEAAAPSAGNDGTAETTGDDDYQPASITEPHREAVVDEPAKLKDKGQHGGPMPEEMHGTEGVVTIRAFVSANGKVRNTIVEKPGKNEDMDSLSVLIITNYAEFEPAKYKGQTVPMWIDVDVEFHDVYITF